MNLQRSPNLAEWYFDDQKIVSHANEIACKISGLSREKIEGQHLQNLFSERSFKQMFKNSLPSELEVVSSQTKKKAVFGQCYFDGKEGVVQAFDFKAQKKKESKIRHQSDLFQELNDLSNSCVTIYSESGEAIYISPSAEQVFGYTAKEIESQVAFEGIHEDDLDAYRNHVKSVLAGNCKDTSFEFRFTKKDGAEVWIESRMSLVDSDENGEEANIQAIAFDITKRKEAEQQLQSSETNARAILNSSDSAIALINSDEQIMLLNDRAKMLSNQLFTKQVAVGDVFLDAMPVENRKESARRLNLAFEGQESKFYREVDDQIRGRKHTFFIKYTPVWNFEGQVSAVNWSAQDVTDQKRVEEYTFNLYQRLNLANNSADIGIWEFDVKKQTFKFDDKCIALLKRQITVEQTLRNFNKLIFGRDRDAFNDLFVSPNVEEHEPGFDLLFGITIEGENHYFKMKGQLLFEGNTVAKKAIGVLIEVTEDKRKSISLERSKKSLQEAQEIANLGSFEYDVLRKHSYWSLNNFDIHGLDREKDEIPSLKTLISWVRAAESAEMLQNLKELKKKEGTFSFDYSRKVKGEERFFQAKVRSVFNEDGLVQRLTGTCQDITEELKMQRELKARNEKLTRYANRLADFSFVNSHKVRAPLSNLLGLLDMLKIEPDEETISMIEESAKELDKVIYELNEILAQQKD